MENDIYRMENDICLRRMTKDDLLLVNYIRNHDSTRMFLRNKSKISLDETYEWFENVKPVWYVILKDQQIVGYIRTSLDTKETICIGCDIHPDKRRMGIATAAYKKIIEMLYESGYLVIWLEVFSENLNAFNLYKKLNFFKINRRIDEDREAFIMVHANN